MWRLHTQQSMQVRPLQTMTSQSPQNLEGLSHAIHAASKSMQKIPQVSNGLLKSNVRFLSPGCLGNSTVKWLCKTM
jgi:hypothetical protein